MTGKPDIDTKHLVHYFRVMRNVTITLEDDVARWVRIRAAERDMSVARLVGELLREKMSEEEMYQVAMNQYLSQAPRRLKKKGTRYPRREELHERAGLR